MLTGNPCSKVWVTLRAWTTASCGGKQMVSPLDQWDMVKVWEMQELHRAPPSNGYGPYGILTICRINLWPAVRIELWQEVWLKQPVAKVRGPIMAGDQGSCRGHHCSETALTGESQFHCESRCIPKTRTVYPLVRKQTVDPLDQWGCVFEWNCRASNCS